MVVMVYERGKKLLVISLQIQEAANKVAASCICSAPLSGAINKLIPVMLRLERTFLRNAEIFSLLITQFIQLNTDF